MTPTRSRASGRGRRSRATADPEVISAESPGACCAIPDAFEGGQVVAQARELNRALPIIARAHSEVEIEHLHKHGATKVVMGEHEIAKAMIADIPPGRA